MLSDTKKSIEEISTRLDVPEEARAEASSLFQKAAEQNLLRGRSAKNLLGGAIYVACRRNNCPRNFGEIAEAFNIEGKDVYRGYKYLVRKLDMNVPPIDPEDYVPYLSSRLDLPEEVKEKGKKLAREANENGLTTGLCPFGCAAATIYIAGYLEGKKVAQDEIKQVADVSEVTLRSRVKEITQEFEMDIEIV